MTTAQKKKSVKKAIAAKPKLVGRPVIARVFRNGRSNAIRIPAALDPGCKEVELTQTADGGFLVKPKREISMKEFWGKVDAAKAKIPGGFHMERPPQGEFEVRVSFD